MSKVHLRRLTANCESLDGSAAIGSFEERSAKQNHFAYSWDGITQRWDIRVGAASHNSLELSPGESI